MTRVELVHLKPTCFRNLVATVVGFDTGINLVLGGNGEGKSNLLEAIAMIGTLRSFRTAGLRPVPCHGHTSLRLEGEVRSMGATLHLDQRLDLGPPLRRDLRINGVQVSVADYLAVFPTFTISSADRELICGPPRLRRAFVDRVAFLLEPRYFDELRSYRRVLAQRNAMLGCDVASDEMEAWEQQLATLAANLVCRRRRALAKLQPIFETVYDSLRDDDFPAITIAYRTEAWLGDGDAQGLASRYQTRYAEDRGRDCQAGHTTVGPHRHDLRLKADGCVARDVLSAGQTKVAAAALRLGALTLVERERDERLPVIIDDVDAELDADVLGRLIDHVGCERQVFLSSAHEEMVATRIPAGARLWMRRGSVIQNAARGEETR